MTDASHITLLPRLLAHVRSQAPDIRLEAARIDGNTERALESGEADLAIGHVPWLGGGMYQQQRYMQDWVCLANPHHPRVRARLTLKQYCNEGHVIIAAGTGAQLLKQALLRGHRARRRAGTARHARTWIDRQVDGPHRYVAAKHRRDTGTGE